MGIDHVDRAFRPKAPLALECTLCGSTKGVEIKVPRVKQFTNLSPTDPASPNFPRPICKNCIAQASWRWEAPGGPEAPSTADWDGY